MAVIQIKATATAGNVPSGLQSGEPAVNLADGSLYVGTGSGNKQINGGFPQAADDASAAALTPPVPVGGLYVTAAGVVQQRLV